MERPGQGESLAAWTIWGALTVAVLVTYSRIDSADLYHVSEEGVTGGLGRSLVLLNFPIAFAAVAFALVAMAVLPSAAWLAAAPAIATSALVPFVVDQDDLDARAVNAIPALGVAVALALTLWATRRAGASFAPRRRGDPMRVAVAAVVVLFSLPWMSAELGFHFPGDVFMGEELGREPDGTVIAAVHLGHHHGTAGALFVLTALLLSRVHVPERRLRLGLTAYLGLMLSYGAVNFVEDLWHEQVVKRGWTDVNIPPALLPGVRPIWGVILALAVLFAIALAREGRREHAAYSGP